jgi:hypothetical protein
MSLLQKLGRKKELRFHAAVLFLFWSLLPHYHFIVNEHPGGTHAHVHAMPAAALLHGIVTALNGMPASPAPAASKHASTNYAAPAAPGGNGQRHSHFVEDDNLAGIPLVVSLVLFLSTLAGTSFARYLSWERALPLARQARAPPPPSFA